MRGGVHLIGSVPLHDTEEVLRTLSSGLGDQLRRLPDGETGARALFAGWQVATFRRHPDFEPARRLGTIPGVRPHRVRSGVDRDRISFSELGFASAARDSYRVFSRLRQEGTIQAGVKFQVSLPTAVNCLAMILAKEDLPAIEPAYERALLSEIDEIATAIPAEDLCIQWDVPWEVRAWDRSMPRLLPEPWFPDVRGGILERLTRLGSRVPAGAELGYHLCHGDYEHVGRLILGLRHRRGGRLARRAVSRLLRKVSVRVAGPLRDMRSVTELADALVRSASRRIDFIHFPVPRSADDAYFAPLAGYRPPAGLEIYLGLIHVSDGLAGAHRRIQSARLVLPRFGVATECGWGRREPDTIPGLIELHRSLGQAVSP